MNLARIYREEDLFPKEITSWIERPYGFLFYNDENKDSYDSNHAIMFRDKVDDIGNVLKDIVQFYSLKGIQPSIYQSISEEGYFEKITGDLAEHGFEHWTEEQKYMVRSERNTITPSPEISVERVTRWNDAYAVHIFEAAGESWEIDVAKKVITNSGTLFFVAYYEGKPVGMTYGHVSDDVCRVDYLLVSKAYRNIGVGRALICGFTEHCDAERIENCYLWPDGDTAERIYHEAGFRLVTVKKAGRATFRRAER